jgi:hypothetical protein
MLPIYCENLKEAVMIWGSKKRAKPTYEEQRA